MNKDKRDYLVGLNLDEKIEYSKKVIRDSIERFDCDKIAIAWTGGKDSTTLLWLFKNVCNDLSIPIPRCMFIDEGDVFDEILDHVGKLKKEWNIDVAITKNTDVIAKVKKLGDIVKVKDLNERNRQELKNINFDSDEFPFEPESYVGNHLMKTVPMKMFIEDNGIDALATAIRWDEQDARVEEDYFSPRNNPEHTRIHPILHFKERDIWDNIHKNKIPFCKLYYQGYRSLGARCSTKNFSDIPAWEQDLESTTERGGRGQDKEAIMGQLRELGYM
ncbi:MAG: phosphoadenosine phosphosulfate reductase family protein [Nitrospirae bacterium]|nr:phosphoadenosine phosphosulfate reductase family protein [Nitrospirota bacterium]